MKKMTVKVSFTFSIFLFLMSAFSRQAVFAAATTVLSHSANASTIGKYKKFELTFQISRQFPAGSFLPYYYYDPSDTAVITAFPTPGPVGADGITIDGHFITPSGKELVVPAFYMQEYTRGTSYRINLSTNYSWKLRFAPEEVGAYQYYITVQDKNGSSRYPVSGTLNFQATTSTSKGFVRKSSSDPRFFAFSNGDSFIPNSAAAQWWSGGRSDGYDKIFNNFKLNNINFTRIWDQNDGYGLTVEGPYDAYPDDYPNAWGLGGNDPAAIAVPKGTQMNQRGNAEQDIIIDSAENNGVYIELCSHSDPYWIWDASVHNEGWNLNKVDFANVKHVNYWKRNFRYKVARWGYSPAVLSWEAWNEHGQDMFSYGTLVQFYQAYGDYQKQTDPYKHFVTTSQGSQNWSPGFWALPQMDLANYHDYMMSNRFPDGVYNDATNFVYRYAQCLRTTTGKSNGCSFGIGDGTTWADPNSKPILWTELDTGTTTWNVANPQPTARLNMRWAGLFSPIGMAPVDWYSRDESTTFVKDKYAEAKVAGNFFKDIAYDKAKFSYFSTSDVALTTSPITATNVKIRVLGMRSQDTQQFYAYVQHKDFIWKYGTTVPAAISGSFSVGGMTDGQYNVEYWDTTAGTKTTATVTVVGGNLTVPVVNLSKSIAIKVRHVNYNPNPPTATPVQPTSTPVQPSSTPIQPTATNVPFSCPTDIDGDYLTGLSDYSVLVANFLKKPLINPKADINGDGSCDLLDYSQLVQHFLQPCQ